jgi:hypothetical protein
MDTTSAGGNFTDNGLVSGGGITPSNGSLVFQVLYDILPTAPLTPSASVLGTTITFTWTAPADNGGKAVSGYRIQRSTDNVVFTTLVANTGTTSTTYTDPNLPTGFTYYYRVAAINAVAVAHGTDYSGPYSTSASAIVSSTAGNAQSLLTVTVTNPNPAPLVFSDFGIGIRFTQIAVSYGSENLFNTVEATTVDPFSVTQVTSAPVSQRRYGKRSYSIDSLLNSTDAGALDVAVDYLTYYYEPEVKIDSITIDLSNLTIEEKLAVLNLDIDSYITVSFIPNRIGDPKIVTGIITGVSHNVTITTHTVELRIRNERNMFILNSDSKGILDQNVLGP